MRHIASRFTSVRLIGLATIAAVGGTVALASGGPADAATTVSAPTLSVNFTPSEIGVGGSTGITYTITNPNTSGTLSNVGFSDTLPSFATIDDPVGQTVASACGATPAIGATPDAGSYSISGLSIKAGASCTISLAVVGNSVGDANDTLYPLTYSTSANGAPLTAPVANETTATLDVLTAPTVAVTTPINHAKYTYGEKVAAMFTCTAPSDASGSTLTPGSCIATDDLGNVYNSGDALDTTDPGVHTLDVEADDNDGDSVDSTITYTVLPSNLVKLRTAKVAKSGALNLELAVPGAGTLKVTEASGKTTVATSTTKATRLYTALALSLKPNATGLKLLGKTGKLKVTVTVAFTPKGGAVHSVTKVVTLIGTKTKVVVKTKTKTKTKTATA